MSETQQTSLVELGALGALLVTGPDARSFLQGQLSADLDRLTPSALIPASCNSAQGRVQAVVWLIERSDAIAMILPAELVATTLARLRKYVLRAKVQLANALPQLRIYGT